MKHKGPEKVPDPPKLPDDLLEIIIQIPAKKPPAPAPKKNVAAA